MATKITTLVLLMAAVGVTLAYTYVAPDEQLGKTTGPRGQSENAGVPRRQKPAPLTPQQAGAHPSSAGQPKRSGDRTRRGVDGSSGGSYASSGSFAGSSAGGGGGGQFNAFPGFQNPNLGGNQPVDFGSFFQYFQEMQNAFQQNANNQGGGYGGGNGVGGGDGASAVASIGPQGGYGSANLSPELGNRFGGGDDGHSGGQFAAPSGGGGGGNYGVFTSSSSGSSDVNGQRQHFQQATAGVNDNGKITSFTVQNPKN